ARTPPRTPARAAEIAPELFAGRVAGPPSGPAASAPSPVDDEDDAPAGAREAVEPAPVDEEDDTPAGAREGAEPAPAAEPADDGSTEREAVRPVWERPEVLEERRDAPALASPLVDESCAPGGVEAEAAVPGEDEPTWVLDEPEPEAVPDEEPAGRDLPPEDAGPEAAPPEAETDSPEPVSVSAGDPGSTLELPRGAEAQEPAPPELDELVERFNRRHAVLFRELRLRVGAGTTNFVRACRRSLGTASRLFDGLDPDAEGRFDADELARRLREGDWESPHGVILEALIDEELATARHLLERSEVAAIERALRDLDDDDR
ncbi:MAG: hypothetical protein D6738_05415, partial [Acidobacteria bacterium]